MDSRYTLSYFIFTGIIASQRKSFFLAGMSLSSFSGVQTTELTAGQWHNAERVAQNFILLMQKEKGSTANASLWCDMKIARSSQEEDIDLIHPFGSMPRAFISLRIMRLSQAEIDSSPSCFMACLIAFSSEGSTRNATCLLPRGNFVFDICCTLSLSYACLTMYSTFKAFVKRQRPVVLETHTGRLSTT